MKQRKRRGGNKGKRKGNSSKNEDLEAKVNEKSERTINQEEMIKKHMPPPFPKLSWQKGNQQHIEILEVLRQEWSHAAYIWNMTLELNIFICAINNSIQEKTKDQKRLPEPLDLLATLPPLKLREEILLYSMRRRHKTIKEEPPKLILKPLITELKYAT
ncbi:hypothetical protein CK203_059255 [Vitis vinifera]|uniref:Uncharacterized protein n=1 Tax=Vitis vinifera TaxID=29760 RepID=A0A438GE98_VITVI|nr:hypothetical protein CK203_059255 [Vitis vinifera]